MHYCELAIDDTVTVSGVAGVVYGVVVDIRRTQDMPDLPDGQGPEVRAIWKEMGVDVIAHIAHLHSGHQVVFAALHMQDGWFDLQQQRLTIKTAAAWACKQ